MTKYDDFFIFEYCKLKREVCDIYKRFREKIYIWLKMRSISCSKRVKWLIFLIVEQY